MTVLLSLLPREAANRSVIHNIDQVTGELLYLQDHKSLTLRWRSFQCIVHSSSAAVHNCFHPDLTVPVGFLLDWDSTLWQSRAASLSCTVHSHTTKNDVSCQKIHAKRFIVPAMHLFMNRYSQATSYHSPIINLKLKLSVKLHTAGEPLTHPVLHCFSSFISPRFNCIDRHQQLFSLSLWFPGRPNQSGHIWRGAHILLLWAFWILDAIVVLYIRFIVRCTILFTVIWSIQVAIPVKPIIGIRNAFRCAIIVALDWMTVDSPDWADI